MRNKKKIFLIIFTILLFIVFLIILIAQNLGSKTLENTNTANNTLSYMISYAKSIDLEKLNKPSLKTKYIHPSNIFAYDFPKDWEFTKNREHIGLIPTIHRGISLNEIVTIFTIKTNLELEDWSKEYDGSGYIIEEIKEINGYKVKYIFKSSPSLTMQIYTFKHNDNIVRLNLRQKDSSSSNPGGYDFTNYVDDFEKLVNSIEFID